MQNAAVLLCLAFGLEAIAHEPSACLDFCTSEVEEVCVWSFSPRTYLNPCHARCEGNRNYIQGNCTAAREEQRHLGRSYVPGRALFSAPAPPANQAEPQEPHLVLDYMLFMVITLPHTLHCDRDAQAVYTSLCLMSLTPARCRF